MTFNRYHTLLKTRPAIRRLKSRPRVGLQLHHHLHKLATTKRP